MLFFYVLLHKLIKKPNIMSIKVKDFFQDYNAVVSTNELPASFADGIISMADSMARTSSLGIYVFDYTKKAVVYVSPNNLSPTPTLS